MDLAGKHIVLGLTGGIAGYKAAELTRALIKSGATVQVVMTDAATHFMTPVTMQALSGHPVYTDQWDARIANNMAHIDLTRNADAIVIAPCSADFIAKLAQGRCDDLLSTLCVARPAMLPLLVAPAMNVEMWQNAATQRNVKQLVADGVQILGPDAGDQACGETGMGRMLEPMQLLDDVIAAFQPKVLLGKRVLITAGPTFEPIDPVRGITNLSSGKMGYALARAAREAGAEVMLVSGPTALATPTGVQRIDVQTAQQMFDIVLSHASGQDLFIAVAAVADWRVTNASEQKLKKTADGAMPPLEFSSNPDILATVAALPDKPYCVGFAAESEDLLKHGKAKRARKGVPLLVGNIAHSTFGKDDNELVLFDANTEIHFPPAHKQILARQLITEISERLRMHVH
ncbi:bifunctional phosphopantothenoylcysteine decarboxylase/phosphopantothenate--cysteine ligase CoaBC [Actimicrobium sp. CCI2.3]|uniref:bifunctional phosphopantothenoylcysteine decarboxylase/phosphopantothenate--cysteine ligase CoaBC n=1 Tax=Actimicrobium sp. CCI2.3 TaxID=3048616 RepID=UPI002AB38049|nr:bifunctional phosphopantothenoylcysteine decarboxylase/phosphopantothenate--cysteine ligase CoaBC [Actimicrobium sp. CCI2.3]MDY7575863.1 bifunctional phosphopantothenoylcysteine decarboxylase/phosphopantothenate--cysteine ligase CoaBC [Actimicrobium sp. CCI2.3]MEB0021677.1 bifunctional phosphopantothenoylcysteine decarboxylase/phosphopantothenate--cysteine ligase CoaBC [Actimicrobium sp. CCI2.3]